MVKLEVLYSIPFQAECCISSPPVKGECPQGEGVFLSSHHPVSASPSRSALAFAKRFGEARSAEQGARDTPPLSRDFGRRGANSRPSDSSRGFRTGLLCQICPTPPFPESYLTKQ